MFFSSSKLKDLLTLDNAVFTFHVSSLFSLEKLCSSLSVAKRKSPVAREYIGYIPSGNI